MLSPSQGRPSGADAVEEEPALLAETGTRQLLAQARKGDEQALDRLFRRYLLPLQRWSRGRLPGWARDLLDTDDLVQETLLRTVRGVGGFDPRHSGAFQAYLRRAIEHRICDEVRRVARRPAAGGTLSRAADPRPTPLDEAIGSQVRERYEAALATLKPKVREAVLARLELGFSYAQVAEAAGYPSPDAARMAVSRALLRLASVMADEGRG
ncbi:MAG: RNA polymerase sigma factor [Acidobacteria bacterium]|nr:MAG: RNA polymerase sigma factor [Acidobacteriota bacterium]